MDGAWHYRQAERMLWLVGPDSPNEPTREEMGLLLWSASTHAALAQAAAKLETATHPISQRWRDVLSQPEPKAPPVPEGGGDLDSYPPKPSDMPRRKGRR